LPGRVVMITRSPRKGPASAAHFMTTGARCRRAKAIVIPGRMPSKSIGCSATGCGASAARSCLTPIMCPAQRGRSLDRRRPWPVRSMAERARRHVRCLNLQGESSGFRDRKQSPGPAQAGQHCRRGKIVVCGFMPTGQRGQAVTGTQGPCPFALQAGRELTDDCGSWPAHPQRRTTPTQTSIGLV
jgi:hypothetical protein